MGATRVRYGTAAVLTVVACLLYLDRYAVGIAAERMRVDLRMTQAEMSWFLSAFFWSYALSQVPAGWMSDRWGPRVTLTAFIAGWSLFTGLLGVTSSVALVLLWRFLCGVTQAGAYPVASGMLRVWFPVGQRGVASSIVTIGGRAGAVLAPILTAYLMTLWAGRWQTVLLLYGGAGIVAAAAVAGYCRNTPREHAGVNGAERALIGEPPEQSAERPPFPWRTVLTSVSLWANSVTQLLMTMGWLFVVTWLPRYLDKVHGVPLGEQALMTAVPTVAGIVGMMGGGWWTDAASRRFGLKWGRRLPLMTTRFLAAAGYGVCVYLGQWAPEAGERWLPWAVIGGLSLATFSSDLGVPAIWAYAQDVGGKYTASIMGWSNMWSAVGAAIAPLVYNAVLGETPGLVEWNWLFGTCAGVFALSGVTSLALDATKPIAAE
ncbi:MAG: MFS transporter [Acidobacteria bacterium]|nr:MFS transporter [Bryobacteraceae bacterium CoA2 C42]